MNKPIMKTLFGLLTAICFFGVLFFGSAIDSMSNLPLVLVAVCMVGMVIFGIPAGAFRQD